MNWLLFSLSLCTLQLLQSVETSPMASAFDYGGIENAGYWLTKEMLSKCRHLSIQSYSPTCLNIDKPAECTQTDIDVVLDPISLHDIDDIAETYTFSGSVMFQWDANCTGNVSVPLSFFLEETVWKPRIDHDNTMNNFGMAGSDFSSQLEAVSVSDTEIQFQWNRFGAFRSTCSMVFTLFPFDEQICSIQYTIRQKSSAAAFVEATFKVDRPFLKVPSMWTVTNWSASIAASSVQFSSSTFTFGFKRKPFFYIYNLMLPCVILTSLVNFSFIIHPELVDRPVFAGTILLALTFMQGQIISILPPKPQTTFLGNYCTSCILLAWVSTVYFLATCGIAKHWPAWSEKEIKVTGLTVALSNLRLVDTVAFVVFMLGLAGIQIYGVTVLNSA